MFLRIFAGRDIAMKKLILAFLLGSLAIAISSIDANPSPSVIAARRLQSIPSMVLWAWERNDDMSFIDPLARAV